MTDNDSSDYEDQADGAKTGAGTEAVQGTPESSTASSRGKSAPGASRNRPHESGYGGRGGEPKSSSETREPTRPD